MAKLENDLRIASREAVLIADTPAQDEGIVDRLITAEEYFAEYLGS